jgi:hypothetical protein
LGRPGKIRAELTRNGKGYNEGVVTSKVLSQWAGEQLSARAQPSPEGTPVSFVLPFSNDASDEIIGLLKRSRLL